MTDATPTRLPVVPQSTWNADDVFWILAHAARRRALLEMARGGAQPASVLKLAARQRLDATLKHIKTLCEAGLVTAGPDPADGRRTLYGLVPTVGVVKSSDGKPVALDFGCCLVRF